MIKQRKLLYVICLVLGNLFLSNCQSELQKPNILLICIDDLRPELKSFGVEYISSPNIDRLAEDGVSFRRHFVNAPSCGPSRYSLLTGLYGPSGNDALFIRANKIAQGENLLDIKNYQSGIYFLQIKNDSGFITKKVIKE